MSETLSAGAGLVVRTGPDAWAACEALGAATSDAAGLTSIGDVGNR